MTLEHLRRDDYDGGTSILKDYLGVVCRFFLDAKSHQRSYRPGEFGQTDWSELGCRCRWAENGPDQCSDWSLRCRTRQDGGVVGILLAPLTRLLVQ